MCNIGRCRSTRIDVGRSRIDALIMDRRGSIADCRELTRRSRIDVDRRGSTHVDPRSTRDRRVGWVDSGSIAGRSRVDVGRSRIAVSRGVDHGLTWVDRGSIADRHGSYPLLVVKGNKKGQTSEKNLH